MHPFLILLVGMIVILGGIIVLRLNAFLALIGAAIVVSFLAPGDQVIKISRVAEAFGKTAGSVGIARRAWATSDKVINTWPSEKLLHWLDARGHRRANHGAPVLSDVAVTPSELDAPPTRKLRTAAEPPPAAPAKARRATKTPTPAKPAARKPPARKTAAPPKKNAAGQKRAKR